jgi:hypothetical protein
LDVIPSALFGNMRFVRKDFEFWEIRSSFPSKEKTGNG